MGLFDRLSGKKKATAAQQQAAAPAPAPLASRDVFAPISEPVPAPVAAFDPFAEDLSPSALVARDADRASGRLAQQEIAGRLAEQERTNNEIRAAVERRIAEQRRDAHVRADAWDGTADWSAPASFYPTAPAPFGEDAAPFDAAAGDRVVDWGAPAPRRDEEPAAPVFSDADLKAILPRRDAALAFAPSMDDVWNSAPLAADVAPGQEAFTFPEPSIEAPAVIEPLSVEPEEEPAIRALSAEKAARAHLERAEGDLVAAEQSIEHARADHAAALEAAIREVDALIAPGREAAKRKSPRKAR
jgi:hypothetical protein